MTRSRVACCLALAAFGLGASAASAQQATAPGSTLPPPPPGAIESRIIAAPPRGDGAGAPPPPTPGAPPAVAVTRPEPAPAATPAVATPASPPAVDATPAKAGPNEPRESPPPSVAPAVTVLFGANSAEISDLGKADLDRVAKTITRQRMSQVELRAFAGSADPLDARKVALARALVVRSYLIDQGVKARIEVGGFGASRASGAGERVDILAPGP